MSEFSTAPPQLAARHRRDPCLVSAGCAAQSLNHLRSPWNVGPARQHVAAQGRQWTRARLRIAVVHQDWPASKVTSSHRRPRESLRQQPISTGHRIAAACTRLYSANDAHHIGYYRSASTLNAWRSAGVRSLSDARPSSTGHARRRSRWSKEPTSDTRRCRRSAPSLLS